MSKIIFSMPILVTDTFVCFFLKNKTTSKQNSMPPGTVCVNKYCFLLPVGSNHISKQGNLKACAIKQVGQ
jgi:hypothetical protein